MTIFVTAENTFIGAFDSFITGAPSRETIETLEECELLVLRRDVLQQLYAQIPLMNEFVRKVLEVTLMQLQQSLNAFILDSPEERYLRILSENPHPGATAGLLPATSGMCATHCCWANSRIWAAKRILSPMIAGRGRNCSINQLFPLIRDWPG